MRPSTLLSTYVDRACRILLLQVLAIVLLKHFFAVGKDRQKCNALLNDGSWLDANPSRSLPVYRNWQPKGCMMHRYTKDDIEECMGRRRIVIAGDSTGRQVFAAIVEKMGSTMEEVANTTVGLGIVPAHHNLFLHAGDINIEFLWEPYLNGSGVKGELGNFRGNAIEQGGTTSAGLFFVKGPGLWFAKGQIDIEKYKQTIEETFRHLKPSHDQQLGQTPESSNLLIMSPISIPWYPALNDYRKPLLTAERIKPMNDYLSTLASTLDLSISRSFSTMIEGEFSKDTHLEDGLHLIESVRNAQADILLNLRCNSKHAAKGYPYDRTCCMQYNEPGMLQLVVVICGMMLLVGLGVEWVRAFYTSRSPSRAVEDITAVATLVLVLCFCYLADRTHIFEKAQKQFSGLEFLSLCIVVVVVGLASITSAKPSSSTDKPVEVMILSRDQTNEWKGWMQVVILIYHYTGASSITSVYKMVRLLVTAYLFLTGYGNTLSMLYKPEFRLKKMAGILLRLNLLTVGLSYMMDTNYIFYYFPALASFWYVVVFAVLAVASHRNQSTWFLCSKIIVAVVVTTTFVLLPGVMEAVGNILSFVFRIQWSVPEWRFRLRLDLFIVYIGMLVAILHQHYRTRHSQQQLCTSSTTSSTQQHWNLEEKLLIGFLALLIIGYALVAWATPDKFAYNHVHPYVSWIPITGFILLRNCHQSLLQHHAANFAWLGEISLETYVLQYHIWLAGDTKGLLQIGTFDRRVEAAIITPCFVWISWRTSKATKMVVAWLIDTNETRASMHEDSSNNYALVTTTACDLDVGVGDEDGEQQPCDVQVEEKYSRLSKFCVRVLKSIQMSIIDSLKWRLFVIAMILWIMNLLSDQEFRVSVGLS